MRNLSWTDCVHYLLDILLGLPLEKEKRMKLLSIIAEQEATAAGQTIPSYRIPLLWESLFLKIREAISMDSTENASSVSSEEVPSGGEEIISVPATKMAPRQAKSRRRKNDATTGTT